MFYKSLFLVRDRLPNLDNLPYSILNNDVLFEKLVNSHIEEFRDRHVVFCISSGRAGSGYLSDILSRYTNSISLHEPLPRMTGRYLDLSRPDIIYDTKRYRRIKLMGILGMLKNSDRDIPYVETSHMFIKTYYDIVTDFFKNIDVIVLRRELSSVLKSFVELGFFSRQLKQWSLWMHKPEFRNLYFDPPMKFEDMDDIDRIITYLLDIEARAVRYSMLYPKTRIHDIYLSEITSDDGISSLINTLGMNRKDNVNINSKRNSRSSIKNILNIDVQDSTYYSMRIKKYLNLCKEKGKSIPNEDIILL